MSNSPPIVSVSLMPKQVCVLPTLSILMCFSYLAMLFGTIHSYTSLVNTSDFESMLLLMSAVIR